MSKSNDGRQFEYDVKYLRKVLSKVDEGIRLPHTLSAEAMRPILDTVIIPSAEPQQHIVWSAMSFLRSRVFSLQSAVSYALAFILIVAVAYGMRLGNDIVDGSIILSPQSSQIAVAQDAIISNDKPAGLNGPAAFTANEEKAATGADMITENSVSTAAAPDIAAHSHSELFGVGGGSEAIRLDEDEQYVYLYRINDRTDPDKADFPITLEIVDKGNGQPVGLIDIPDMDKIHYFCLEPDSISIVGSTDESVVSRCYDISGLHTEQNAIETFTVSQPGKYENSHLFEGILHTVTLGEGGVEEDFVTQLPDAVSDMLCIITAADMRDGSVSQVVYRGADKGISIHDRSIYISYMAQSESSAEQELSMAQIRLEGIDFNMVIVP